MDTPGRKNTRLSVVRLQGNIQASRRAAIKRVVIVGCGFAGIAAARRLSKSRLGIEVVMIDSKREQHFLPLIPELISTKLPRDTITHRARRLCALYDFDFISDEVRSVDLHSDVVWTSERSLHYDYLIIAAGLRTNFFGNRFLSANAWKFDDADDAEKIRATIGQDRFKSYVVCGAGCSGIQLATHIRKLLRKRKQRAKVVLVEKRGSILHEFPKWQQRYALSNLKRLKIDVVTNDSVSNYHDSIVNLTSGGKIESAMLIWTAGVRGLAFIDSMGKNITDRSQLQVDKHLAISDNCFGAGDSASTCHGQTCARGGLQQAVLQGDLAAANVIRLIKKQPLKAYKSRPCGYILPMANGRACGMVFGMSVAGSVAVMLHFLRCVAMTRGFGKKMRLLMHAAGQLARIVW